MNYDEAVAAFFQPGRADAPLPAVVSGGTPARRLRDAAEPVAMHVVWSRSVNEALAGIGLDFLSGYVWGRAASLGEPEPAVAAAAFAWFEPGLVTGLYEQGRAAVGRDRLLATRHEATVASLAGVLAGEDVGEVAAALRRGVEAADGAGRPLFAGLRSRPWPTEPFGRLWRGCELVREHRGDSHVAAAVAAGLTPVQMNVLTELYVGMPLLSYTATRAWPEQAMADAVATLEKRGWLAGGELTDEGRSVRDEVEERTDAQEQPVVDAIGSAIEQVVDRLNAWGQRCVDAAAFPPDPAKRWAG